MKKQCFALLKFLFQVLIIFLPASAFAATSINFDPPASDVSVTFLTDIFGVVDGVLSGGGSQIMGSMFAIFNASVLALGGMILIYTTLVATLNTAGDGQVLGKSWSSIWIPVRTTIGLSLLFTYPSGYSVLQVFIMWIVVQGVGAADLIWNAALGYLQRGGVIVQPMPTQAEQESAMVSSADMLQGASAILTGITCMQALQQQLQTLQTTYQNQLSQSNSGPCAIPTSGTLTTDQQNMSVLCNNAIPDLVSSSNVMQVQTAAMAQNSSCSIPSSSGGTESCSVCVNSSNQTCTQGSAGCTCTVNPNCQNNLGSVSCSSTATATPVVLPMPNLSSDSPYYPLNGICGTVTWNLMDSSTVESTASQLGVSEQDAAVMENSRAIAVQQMYSDLTPVAQSMVQNDLTLYSTTAITCNSAGGVACYFNTSSYTPSAPFGVPATDSDSFACSGLNSPYCTTWISPQSGFSPLLNGTELWGAVEDYNSIMEPTLNAEENTSTIESTTGFIDNAEAQGWILAGSYFFNLENVNNAQYSDSSSGIYDTDSGMVTSINGVNYPQYPPGLGSSFCAGVGGASSLVCTWYGAGNSSNTSVINIYNDQMSTLIQGPTPTGSDTTPAPAYSATTTPVNSTNWPVIYSNTDERNTTVYGYASNASNIVTAGQQGSSISMSTFKPNFMTFSTPSWGYSCSSGLFGYYSIAGDICLLLGQNLLVNLIDWIWEFLAKMISTIIFVLLLLPIEIFSGVFMQTIEEMNANPSNPIVALATAGAGYIDLCVKTWIIISLVLAGYGMVPLASGIIIVIILVIGPFVYTWLGLVFGIGVTMAYFIPMIPYVLFTFGSIGWLMGVIEAMVAAPIVALGVMLPEGHDVFGQGKEALMLIFYAFLRPSMMIIGYIAGIILASVGIWVINAGFTQFTDAYIKYSGINTGGGNDTIAYIFAFLFLFFAYVSMCFYVIEQAFEMIYRLPDGILRWIGGGTQDAFGSGVAGKGLSEVKGQTKETGDATKAAATQKRSLGDDEDKKKPEGKGGMGGSAGGGGGGIHMA
jgi:defect-in-organelle-trafficking protein DotA